MVRAKNFLLVDEAGSATVWSIFWTLIFLFMAGVAIDVANAYRYKAALQATADASSLGGMRAYMHEQSYQGYTGDTTTRAEAYRGLQVATVLAAANMSTSRNGVVVPSSNVTFGRWASGSFDPTGTPVNAAEVVAVRTDGNSNELPTLLLGRFGILGSWDVGANVHNRGLFFRLPQRRGYHGGRWAADRIEQPVSGRSVPAWRGLYRSQQRQRILCQRRGRLARIVVRRAGVGVQRVRKLPDGGVHQCHDQQRQPD